MQYTFRSFLSCCLTYLRYLMVWSLLFCFMVSTDVYFIPFRAQKEPTKQGVAGVRSHSSLTPPKDTRKMHPLVMSYTIQREDVQNWSVGQATKRKMMLSLPSHYPFPQSFKRTKKTLMAGLANLFMVLLARTGM